MSAEGSPFWLDETVTWWASNHGLRELITRCTFWPGSILYNAFILLLRSWGAHREWILRVPSLAGVAGSAFILFDLARRWFSKRVAIAAVVFYCTQPWVAFAAADARPYGLGMLFVTGSTWLMLRWLDTQRTAHACAYAVAAALVIHFHMLFATVLVFHVIFLVVAMPRRPRVLRQAAIAACIVTVLALPLLPQYLYAFTGRSEHTFSNPRTLWDLFRQFLPTVPMLGSALVAAVLPKWRPTQRTRIARRSMALAGLWAGVPLVLLYVAAKLSGSDLFVGRYALPYVPGIALCFGLVLEYLSPRLRTGLVLLVFLIPTAVSSVRGEFASHTTWGNWAAAIRLVDSENAAGKLPVMMRSPFPESDFFDWRTAKMNDSALYAPLAYYSSGSDWYPLPATFSAGAATAIDGVMQSQAGSTRGLFFVMRDDGRMGDSYLDYFRSRGSLRQVGDFEGVRVFEWQL